MLHFIQRWHREIVRTIAATGGISQDLSHHHQARARHRHSNQRVADWHARHAAEVMAATTRLGKWERFVYKEIRRLAR